MSLLEDITFLLIQNSHGFGVVQIEFLQTLWNKIFILKEQYLFNFSMWYQLFFTNLVDQMPKLKKAQLLLLTSTQPGFTCVKFTIETLVQCMKYVQS